MTFFSEKSSVLVIPTDGFPLWLASSFIDFLVKLLNAQIFMPLVVVVILYISSLFQISGSSATSCWSACSPPLGLSAPVAPQGRADSRAARSKKARVTKTVKTMMAQPTAADISSTFANHFHICIRKYFISLLVFIPCSQQQQKIVD